VAPSKLVDCLLKIFEKQLNLSLKTYGFLLPGPTSYSIKEYSISFYFVKEEPLIF